MASKPQSAVEKSVRVVEADVFDRMNETTSLIAQRALPASPHDWRLISIEGSARLAKRVNQSYQINPCVGPSWFYGGVPTPSPSLDRI